MSRSSSAPRQSLVAQFAVEIPNPTISQISQAGPVGSDDTDGSAAGGDMDESSLERRPSKLEAFLSVQPGPAVQPGVLVPERKPVITPTRKLARKKSTPSPLQPRTPPPKHVPSWAQRAHSPPTTPQTPSDSAEKAGQTPGVLSDFSSPQQQNLSTPVEDESSGFDEWRTPHSRSFYAREPTHSTVHMSQTLMCDDKRGNHNLCTVALGATTCPAGPN